MQYGDVLPWRDLAAGPLPTPRGPLSGWVVDVLAGPLARRVPAPPPVTDDPLYGDDAPLALYCLYELHYRGFAGVDENWEWDPALLAARQGLEARFEGRLRAEVPEAGPCGDISRRLREICAPSEPRAPSVSTHLAGVGTEAQLKEFVIHRSVSQLKEADPHTWAIPRLAGRAKAALVEIQRDEYGEGRARDMHQNLFGLTMERLGLDTGYNAYLDHFPGVTLTTANLVSFFGLHRRWRGALVGHLAVFEMTSVDPMADYSRALHRLGHDSAARHFFDAHVVADAHHSSVAADDLAGELVRQEPHLAADIVLGAQAVMAVEAVFDAHLLASWAAGRTSLRRRGPEAGARVALAPAEHRSTRTGRERSHLRVLDSDPRGPARVVTGSPPSPRGG